MDSANSATLARKEGQQRHSQQAVRKANVEIERVRRNEEGSNRRLEEAKTGTGEAERQRAWSETWSIIGQGLQTIQSRQNQDRLRRRQAEEAEYQRYLEGLKDASSTQRPGDSGLDLLGPGTFMLCDRCGMHTSPEESASLLRARSAARPCRSTPPRHARRRASGRTRRLASFVGRRAVCTFSRVRTCPQR